MPVDAGCLQSAHRSTHLIPPIASSTPADDGSAASVWGLAGPRIRVRLQLVQRRSIPRTLTRLTGSRYDPSADGGRQLYRDRRGAMGDEPVAGGRHGIQQHHARGIGFRDGMAVEIDNSLAVRPGVSLWLDLNSRAAFNVFTGYVITRPEVTFLESGQFTRRALRADTAVFSIGLVYKVF